MEAYQRIILILYGIFAFFGFLKGLNECKNKKNPYGNAHLFNLIGAFVWGDAVIFGLFWTLASGIFYLLNDWILFLLTISLFWAVRSFGETIYWFNQQFSKINRNPPGRLFLYKIFHGDAVWFIYQIFWQCITIISIIFSIYFAARWLQKILFLVH